MEVALATGAVSRPVNLMTARGGDIADEGPGTTTPSVSSKAEPLTNRFPKIAFSYDVDASRLVMLYRDPADGKAVAQIPTEAALKQYKEAQKEEKNAERAAALEMTIGGDAAGRSLSERAGAGGPGAGGPGAGGTGAVVPPSSSGTRTVAYSAPSTTHAAAAVVASIGSGSTSSAGRVDVVI